MAPRRPTAPEIERARAVLKTEADAIAALCERLGPEFIEAVRLLYDCRGKVVVTGVGKSGIICQKIASTLASTGSPAFFLHPAEGLHGDLGVCGKDDIVFVVSNSGETEEVVRLLPVVKRLGLPLIAISGGGSSTLAKAADVFLDSSVKEEACSMGLAPTASTTAALALGDALAVALLEKRGFTEEQFALLHPGGALGKKLLLRVEDLMHAGDALPLVLETLAMKDVILEISTKRFGAAGVLDGRGEFVGVITDGDLRRGLERYPDILQREAREIMTTHPKWIERSDLAAKALRKMEDHSITSLFVFNGPRPSELVGILHIHDILKAGIA